MRWFFPEDIKKIPDYLPAGRVSVIKGVDDQPGLVVGGLFQAGNWQKTSGGFYVLFESSGASDCLRLHQPPLVAEMEFNGQHWLVPHLLNPQAGGWVSALPRVWTPGGWQDPKEYAPLQERIRALSVAAERDEGFKDETVAEITADLLALCYHFTHTELSHSGWLTEDFCAAVITMAVGGNIGQA